ncbi:MAG TPA: ABC transporter permease [Bryobacteraceae bacterium]|nr:ABC transporter permease [Bryobacteraceae bacterium]
MISALRSARSLTRYWKLTAIAAFSLSVAIALGVLGLSILNTVLLLPPSAPSPERLVTIYSRTARHPIEHLSYADYQYFRTHNHVFTEIGAAPNSIGLNDDFNFEGRDVKVITRSVSETYFATMGIRPFLGRLLVAGDDQTREHIAVMTWSCWKRLGSDPHIVGKVLAKYTIVGVTPKEFTGSFYGAEGDLISPLSDGDRDGSWRTDRTARRFVLVARLKPGVTRLEAQAEMLAMAGQLASAFPADEKGHTPVVARASLLPPDALSTAQWMTAILMTFVLLVLLLACANVANLLLAVAVGRRQEAAIKLALGAPRGRLIREFLGESSLLCLVSGIAGFALAALVIVRYSNFTVTFPMYGAFSFGMNLHLDATVIALTLLLMLIASLATGLAPALYASSPALAGILGSEIVVGGARRAVRRNALVVVEIAVGTLVLVGMGLCQRNLYNLRHVDLGFSARNLVAVTLYLPGEGYNQARGKAFYETLRATAAALPGVEAVSLTGDLPLLGVSPTPVEIPDALKTTNIHSTVVDAAYFSTFGIRILSGRAFDSSDREEGRAVGVINRKMAEMFWPGKEAVGRTLTAGNPPRKLTVVGVAADGKYLDLDESPEPFLYYPLSQHYRSVIHVVARTKGDPRIWIEPFAESLRKLGLKIMIQPMTFESWLDLSLLTQRIAAGFVGVLSGLGVLLAAIGLFGAVSYSVSARKKELGIRTALGARPSQLLSMILRQTGLVAGAGIAVGTVLGIMATIVFRSEFYGIGAAEWTVLLPVAAAMLALSLLVAYFSARSWVTVDPMEAVRHA